MKDVNDPTIRRFPRLMRTYPKARLTLAQMQALDITPRGYRKLTKRQRKIARLVVNGETVKQACKMCKVDPNTYYRWMRYHKLFKAYYIRYGESIASGVEGRLNAKLGRAVRVIEDTLDGPDPYHRHEAAVKLLSGRGKYRKSVDQKNELKGAIDFRNNTPEKPMNQEVVIALVEAMKQMATGTQKEVKPKFIDAEIIKELPAPTESVIDDASINPKAQEARQAKAS